MKKLFNLLLAIMLIANIFILPTSAAETEIKGESSIENATEIKLDTKYMAVLDDAIKDRNQSDVDWYTFTTKENNAYYRFEFAHYTGDGKYFVLCTYSEKELYKGNLYNNNSDIEYILLEPSETYYIKVYHTDSYDGIGGKYGINVTYCPDDYKNNINEAEKISVNDTIKSSTECSYDLDYFTFNDAEDGIYTFEITTKIGISQRIRVFNSDGEELAESWLADAGKTRTVEVQLHSGETYYVEISGYVSILNNDASGEYVMSIYATGCKHQRTSKNNYVTEYEKINGDENYHYIIKYYDKVCDECGTAVQEMIQDSKYTERHSFEGNVCENCGFAKESAPVATPKPQATAKPEVKDTTNPGFKSFICDNSKVTNRTETPTVTFYVTGSDNVGVAKIEGYLDGVPIKSASGDYLEVTIQTSALRNGEHVFEAVATDTSGNTFSHHMNINVNVEENTNSLSQTPQQYPTNPDGTWEPAIRVKVDGKEVNFDVPPQIINDRTMIPLRAVAEAFGADVEWHGNSKSITIKGKVTWRNDMSVWMDLSIGSNSISCCQFNNDFTKSLSDGFHVDLDSPPIIVNDRTLVPIRAIAETFGYDVFWYDDTMVVNIVSK